MGPPQPGDMTEANKNNRPARSARDAREPSGQGQRSSNKGTSSKRTTPEYTPRQREKMQKGLRILARIIVRAHLRKQAELSGSE